MKLRAECISCIISKCAKRVEDKRDEDEKSLYMRDILAAVLSEPDNTSPECMERVIDAVYEKHFGAIEKTDYTEIKYQSNKLMLEKRSEIERIVRDSEDPLFTAIKYSLAANYIDYISVDVKTNELLCMLENAAGAPLAAEEYPNLLRDLENAETLVFVHDNCGEIVMDKLLIKLIKERFPKLTVKSCVRGGAAANDATAEDAEQVRLYEVAEVFNTGAALLGLPLKYMCESAINELKAADVILCKGQANFETTFDCGLNIYYLFLCKCSAFYSLFNVERFASVLLNNLRLEKLKAERGIRGGHEFPMR